MKRIVLLLTLLVASLSFAQEGTDFNPRQEVIYKNQVWTWDTDEEMRQSGDSWIEDMMDLKLHSSPTTLNATWFSRETLDRLDENALYLEVPFMSCGIGYDVYVLVAETDNTLMFEQVDPRSGKTIGNAIVFSKRRS